METPVCTTQCPSFGYKMQTNDLIPFSPFLLRSTKNSHSPNSITATNLDLRRVCSNSAKVTGIKVVESCPGCSQDKVVKPFIERTWRLRCFTVHCAALTWPVWKPTKLLIFHLLLSNIAIVKPHTSRAGFYIHLRWKGDVRTGSRSGSQSRAASVLLCFRLRLVSLGTLSDY